MLFFDTEKNFISFKLFFLIIIIRWQSLLNLKETTLPNTIQIVVFTVTNKYNKYKTYLYNKDSENILYIVLYYEMCMHDNSG